MNFLKALEDFSRFNPEEAVSQLFAFFRNIADLDSKECAAAYQALHFFYQEVREKVSSEVLLRLKRIRHALVCRMAVLNDPKRFQNLPGLSWGVLYSGSAKEMEEGMEDW